MLALLTLLACPTEGPFTPDPDSNLCATITNVDDSPAITGASVVTIAAGHGACEEDSGGDAWWGEVVAEPEVAEGHLEATVDPGSYGVEIYAEEGWAGCGAAEVTDTSTCSADIEIELGELIQADKPNVYLYPTKATDISVKIPAWKRITESEPRYPIEGWRVRAWPDGQLDTAAGKRDFLFYEINQDLERFQTEEGWCVRGNLAQATIEDAMVDMGFLANEVHDFADAWDAEFPSSAWMTVYPQIDDLTALRIDPAPDHLLRAWFLVADGCQKVSAPQLPVMERRGYHAAEWGVAFKELDRPAVLVEGWR